MRTKAVVVGTDHYNTLWVARTLAMGNVEPVVVLLEKEFLKSYVLKSRYIHEGYVEYSEKAFINRLLTIPGNEKISLFSTNDVVSEVIDSHFGELNHLYFLPVCSEKSGQLTHWMDKDNMNEAAEKCGFNIPWGKKINLNAQSLLDIEDIVFPCIIKPQKSDYGTKNDVRICNNTEELKIADAYLKTHCSYVIVQQFLQPEYEITIDSGRSRKTGEVLLPGIIKKDRTCNSTYNLGMVTVAHTERDVEMYVDPGIIRKFLDYIDYDGLCSFDMLFYEGKAYFLEINLRTDGDMFICTTAGVNFPLWWIKSNVGELYSGMKQFTDKPTYGMIEISYMKYLPWKTPLAIIKDLWRNNCCCIFNLKDMMPFIYKFIYSL